MDSSFTVGERKKQMCKNTKLEGECLMPEQ